MDLKKLEYFVVSVDERSFLKAAEKLYTTQPNISKSIAKLEKEVNISLLNRTGKGVTLTQQGEKFYHYAKNVLRQIDIMKDFSNDEKDEKLSICSYPSNMISRILVDIYKSYQHELHIEYHEGTVQEVIDLVSSGTCELGIVYVDKNQIDIFKHVLAHKKLEFIEMKQKKLSIYVGKNNPLYVRTAVSVKELSELKFVRGLRDYFSVEHHFSDVNLSALKSLEFNDTILTNSDHLVIDLLEETDICCLGIDFMNEDYKQYNLKMIEIEDYQNFLTLGYVKYKRNNLSEMGNYFIEYLTQKL